MDGYYSRPRLLYTGPSSWRLFSTLLVMLTSSFQIAFSSEIYLNGTTSAIVSGSSSFPPTNPQNYHLGFSFRTCRQLLLQQNNNGPVLLSQVASNGDRLSIELLSQPGSSSVRIRFSLSVDSIGYSSDSTDGHDLGDNQWHDVDISFQDQLLRWRLDGSEDWNPLANTSDVDRSPLFRRSVGDNSIHQQSITLGGRGFIGCILQGPSLRLDSNLENAEDILVGQCPIPQQGNCSAGDRSDPCWSRPCMNDGRCQPIGTTEFTCRCTRRYGGNRCELDTGSLCERPDNICLNGGTCLEQVTGNGTTCLCLPNFSGTLCENRIRLPRCQVNTCLNNGTCFTSNGVNQCVCPHGFEGQRCETDIDECNPQPCKNGGTCIDGQIGGGFTCDCEGTGYQGDRCQRKSSHCQSEPCQHGGSCFNRYTSNGYVCQCSGGFTGGNCEIEKSSRMVVENTTNISGTCETDSCLNGGICSSSLNNEIECLCPDEFTGPRCAENSTATSPSFSTSVSSSVSSSVRSSVSSSSSTSVGSSCESEPCRNNGSCTDLIDGGYDCLCSPGFGGPDCSVSVDFSTTNVNINAGCSSGSSRPCLNGGTCDTSSNGSSICECRSGFEGDRCQDNIDECSVPRNPCIHSTTCIDLVADYQCVCEAGWTGRNCDIDIDECASDPCLNNGTCTSEHNGRFTCECPAGFLGTRCQVNRDECALPEAVCQNNGTCVDGINNYTCSCPPQYAGRHCELEFDACASGPCQNGASCITTRPQQNFYCECLPGFEGMYCENDIDECVSIQCTDGKVCFDLINRHECRCPTGFGGPQCRTNIDECAPTNSTSEPICQNGGSCIDGIGNYTCSCPPGFTGRHCSEDIDECAVLRPCVYGICQNSIGSYQCYCRPGFSGDNCNLEFDECLSHPCQNNGTCNNLINGYECVCAPGFTGKDCDININECESSPCQNNGTCIDGIAAFSCICLPGFTGPRCEINIDECESSPCLNEGLCIDGIDSYRCDCNDTGFTGKHCETNVDDCQNAPCLHDSECVDLIKDYLCECHSGYRGKNCEQDINECIESDPSMDEILQSTSSGLDNLGPCLNGAECFERSNRSLYEPGAIFHQDGPFSYNTSGGYLCRCIPGFEGTNCQINIDECALAATTMSTSVGGSSMGPCKFGTCVDGINNYTCSCFPGYEGDECESEIDECVRYEPCRNGASCVDKIADYTCQCPPNYGGKNCSVELLGCIDVSCLHGGTCQPFLEEESIHRFTCQCPFGFHGQLCQHATTMSFNGSAFMPVQTNRDEGYDLSFRFRTTLPSGLLAVGQGQTYYRLELLNGQLNLHSSLLNKWEGVFLGSNLNDAEWQSVRVRFNFTHLHLVVNQQEAMYPINPVESINSTETSFGMTVLGGATSFLRILAQGLPFFIGCMENVVVNGQWVIPSHSPTAAAQAQQATSPTDQMLHLAGIAVEMGCPRVDHCRPNPCQNAGTCNDLWTFFNCSCQRPFLGDTCQFSYTAATFGHENVTSPANSLVSVSITPQERLALSSSMDISMFVRTREPGGLIFYLGTPPSDAGGQSYIAAELQEGRLLVVADLGDGEQLFPVDQSPPLNDGSSHLVQVIRDRLQLRVRINDTLFLNDSLTSFKPLQAQVLFLGGLPPSARLRRQTIASQLATGTLSSTIPSSINALEGQNFKGVLQDIQIKTGNITRIVEIFPLDSRNELSLPDSLGTVQRSNDVLEGVVSDDSCRSNPCVNGGNCTVTWNDFLCICPSGFKGKTCSELEFCAIHTCPVGGSCQNLNDGYECLTSATFNGVNTTVQYGYTGSGLLPVGTIQFAFRSRQGGTALIIQNESRGLIKFLRVDVEEQGVVTRWIDRDGLAVNESLLQLNDTFNGSWHSVTLNLTAILGLNSTRNLLTNLVAGQIILGGSATIHSVAERDVDDLERAFEDSTTISSEGVLAPATLILPPPAHFRGCLNEFRIGGLLLPFFPAQQLLDDPSARKFRPLAELDDVEVGVCRVCYDHECFNGAKCLDPLVNHTCECLPGYEGDLCQINIDECAENACNVNKSLRCVDGVANYTCQCQTGWTGWLCDEDINECDPDPCQNNATCDNLVGRYFCNCTEDFVGVDCERPRIVTCANDPCLNGANCSDTFDLAVSDQAINYTCACPFGFEGVNCQLEIDYCVVLDLCQNGAYCSRVSFEPGYICECAEGFSGDLCEVDINECQQRPCLNGGRCIDGVNNFTCDCSNTGYEGYLCEVDVDECSSSTGIGNPCVRGRCLNSPGSYTCICDSEDDCGRHCDRKDPCKAPHLDPRSDNGTVCYNGATCTAFCDDPLDGFTGLPVYRCSCLDGFGGSNCSLAITTRLEPNLKLVAIIVPIVAALLLIAVIGSVVFFMMARNKRATRGTYSPSRQEMFSPRVEMGQVMKPPPEERLI